jgi:hypothetical protein
MQELLGELKEDLFIIVASITEIPGNKLGNERLLQDSKVDELV